jgi:predicted alpha/beta hydrolase family esterase
MTKQVLFVQGGSKGAYAEDAKLAASLREKLGPGYDVRYPKMPNEDEPEYASWKHRICEEVRVMGDGAVLVGHSIGASVLIKLLTEHGCERTLAGVFLIAAPFWHEHDFWRWDEVKLPREAASMLPKGVPVFFYHGRGDEFVPCAHVDMYSELLPQATVRRLDGRNHQLNDDLTDVADDIRQLS